MGFSPNQRSFQARGGKRPPMSEINITPFVDVMLVLLIIFMVTAPLLTSGVHVDLPETSSSPISGQDEPISITITSAGEVFLQKNPIKKADLVEKLMAITKRKQDTRIFIRGDKKVNYGTVMEVVGIISSAGFSKVAFITENPDIKSSGR